MASSGVPIFLLILVCTIQIMIVTFGLCNPFYIILYFWIVQSNSTVPHQKGKPAGARQLCEAKKRFSYARKDLGGLRLGQDSQSAGKKYQLCIYSPHTPKITINKECFMIEANQVETSAIGGVSFTRFRLSWVAYLRPLLVLPILLGITFLLAGFHQAIIYVGSALAVLLTIYKMALLKSTYLFANDEGVWVYSGIFPWSRGAGGVRWRDIDDAQFTTGFINWLFKAYTIKINHRFTKGNEISLPLVKNGDKAVDRINALHGSYLRNGGGY
ncbi:hypothetical protein [Vibrio harveyi]|uniref:hypothetical protein n=2 Tax=Vibrionales TaxID=135623 RepID=UPI0025B2726C|nr:hypothetical protein [Vibrio harveyi]WJT10905.1 hypothetical protein PH545_27860 [Vibrio harveyi]